MAERKLIDQTQAHQVTAPNGTVYNVLVNNAGEFYTEKAADGVANDAVALWKASSYDGSSQFLNDLSGNGHHLRIGSTQPAYIADGTLQLPGVDGNYASTPDSDAVSITGNIDIRVHARLADWTPSVACSLVSKLVATGTRRAYNLFIGTTGTVSLTFALGSSPSSHSTATSTVVPTVIDGGDLWLRATRNSTTGDVIFYTSADGIQWTQLGPMVSAAAGTLNDNTEVLAIGASPEGLNVCNGQIYYAEVRNGIDGEVVAKFDPSGQEDFTTSWYSETGEQWTVNSTAGTDTNEPKFLPKESSNYLYLPGVSGNYASVPDANNLDITGDIDIRIKVALDDWTPSNRHVLIAKDDIGSQRSWAFSIESTGTVRLEASGDGSSTSSANSSTTPTVADGAKLWLRVSWRQSDGRVQFFTSPDGADWQQLGSNQTLALASLFSSSTSVNIGARASGLNYFSTAKFYRAIIRNVVNDQTVLDVDFSKASPSSTTFTAETGQTVTINRSSSGLKSVVVDRDLFLFGTDDYMECPDPLDGTLDFAAADSFSVVAVFRAYGTSAGQVLIAKQVGSISKGWSSVFNMSTTTLTARLHDGTITDFDTQTGIVAGSVSIVTMVRHVAADNITAYLNGVAAGPTTDPTTAGLANDEALRIGRFSGTGTTYADMEFIGAAIWRRALTDEEITLLSGEFGV